MVVKHLWCPRGARGVLLRGVCVAACVLARAWMLNIWVGRNSLRVSARALHAWVRWWAGMAVVDKLLKYPVQSFLLAREGETTWRTSLNF